MSSSGQICLVLLPKEKCNADCADIVYTICSATRQGEQHQEATAENGVCEVSAACLSPCPGAFPNKLSNDEQTRHMFV